MASLRAWLTLVNLALAAGVGYGAALTTAQVVQNALEVATPPPATRAVQRQESAPQRSLPLAAFEPILEHNVFAARRSRPEPKRPAGGQVAEAQAADDGKDKRTASLKLYLTGVVRAGPAAFASVMAPPQNQERVYRPGECLPATNGDQAPDPESGECKPEQGRLVAVEAAHIAVLFQGERLTFELGEEPEGDAPESASSARPDRRQRREAPRQSAPDRTAQEQQQESNGEIAGVDFPATRQGNSTEVRVPNAEVEKAFENFSDVLRQARVVPYNANGLQGFQIRSIRSGSIFDRIGLENYDVIKSVNGQEIVSADQALSMLTAFRNETHITLSIRRSDQDLTFDYFVE